ncbi:MAG: peroxiredoxin [Rhizobiaceae bacterium]
MTIAIGDKLPEATFKTVTADGPANISTADIFAGKKVVLFGVPGAFTKTCHNQHVPSFIENYDVLRARGIDTIAVVATNDHFVMNAWADATKAAGKLLFLADYDGSFARATGLDVDLSAAGMGLRYTRFSMIVDDGKVAALNIEPKSGQAIETGAIKILEQLAEG